MMKLESESKVMYMRSTPQYRGNKTTLRRLLSFIRETLNVIENDVGDDLDLAINRIRIDVQDEDPCTNKITFWFELERPELPQPANPETELQK